MRKVYGIAIYDSLKRVTKRTKFGQVRVNPIYDIWHGMLMRCYSQAYAGQKGSPYTNTIVCDDWLYYSKFEEWCLAQDWVGNDLDKDIICPGNQIYSPDRCCFVPHHVNSVLIEGRQRTKGFPKGVKPTKYGAWQARVSLGRGKGVKHLGIFQTKEEAALAYRVAKHTILMKLSLEFTDIRIRRGLQKHAELALHGLSAKDIQCKTY